MEITSYRDLKVWQLAMIVAERTYKLTEPFPASELYGMTSQMRRASVSIAANIAEGYGRESSGAYVNFLKTAQGSLKELETHALLAGRVAIAQPDTLQPLLDQCDELGRMLRSLIRSIESQPKP